MRHIHYEVSDEIALLKFDSPSVNAFTDGLIDELQSAIDTIKSSTLRVVIITGKDRYFSSGGDINRFLAIKSEEEAQQFVKLAQGLMDGIASIECPVLAAVNGYALGGGTEIALACDIRIASEDAVFGLPEVQYGILAGAGGTQRLARLIGPGRAKLMMYSADKIGASEAFNIGLIDKVTSGPELMLETMRLARKIAANSPAAVRNVKKCVDEGLNVDLVEGLRLERDYWARLIPKGDYIEGAKAFLEKRSPVFNSE